MSPQSKKKRLVLVTSGNIRTFSSFATPNQKVGPVRHVCFSSQVRKFVVLKTSFCLSWKNLKPYLLGISEDGTRVTLDVLEGFVRAAF